MTALSTLNNTLAPKRYEMECIHCLQKTQTQPYRVIADGDRFPRGPEAGNKGGQGLVIGKNNFLLTAGCFDATSHNPGGRKVPGKEQN